VMEGCVHQDVRDGQQASATLTQQQDECIRTGDPLQWMTGLHDKPLVRQAFRRS
jgi:hypothetical protein